jgi:hypothetical protein
MTNTRKNALHQIVEEELREKVWLALEAWVKSGESFAFVEGEVEEMLEILQDYAV